VRGRDVGNSVKQQLMEEEEYVGYNTPKTPGGTQLHTRPFLTCWAMVCDFGLSR